MAAKPRDVLFVIDPLASLNPHSDTSLVMMEEALRRGYSVFVAEIGDLYLEGSRALAQCQVVAKAASAAPLQSAGERQARALGSFAAVFMRKDPPFDHNYITATWILDFAHRETHVFNDPTGLRELNEKLTVLHFPELSPPTRIVRRKKELLQTLDDFGGSMVLKPILGFGGREILIARRGDPNLHSIFELATHEEGRWTVAQAFLHDAVLGDKRILLVDGEPIGAVLRVPAPGESRGNFHAGGSPAPTELSPRDREISRHVGLFLREKGQFFAGIDIIGGHLTEVNVTSPTGMQEINRLGELTGDATMQALFWQAVERKLLDA